MLGRGVLACTAVLLGLLFLAPISQAATCGSPEAEGAEPSVAALTLKPGESTTEINSGRKTSERQLIFVFSVSECRLESAAGIHAKVRSSDVGPSAFGPEEIELDGSVLVVQIPVIPGNFDPGKHSAVVTVAGPTIATSISTVNLQRTENRWYIPALICVVAALIGLVWIAYTASLDVVGDLKVRAKYIPLALVAAIAGAYLIYKTNYLDAELWELDPGSIASLFVAALIAATGASTVGALAKVIPSGAPAAAPDPAAGVPDPAPAPDPAAAVAVDPEGD
jgi:hypothetical protein